MLACILGKTGEIFFPKLGEEQMMTFSSIADRFLEDLGYKVKYCKSEEEARKFAFEMGEDSKEYPVYYFSSDTTGEKGFEEFYIEGEKLNMERFSSLGVIEDYSLRPDGELKEFFSKMTALFERKDFEKKDVVDLLKEFIPNFMHEEKGKNLDSKM